MLWIERHVTTLNTIYPSLSNLTNGKVLWSIQNEQRWLVEVVCDSHYALVVEKESIYDIRKSTPIERAKRQLPSRTFTPKTFAYWLPEKGILIWQLELWWHRSPSRYRSSCCATKILTDCKFARSMRWDQMEQNTWAQCSYLANYTISGYKSTKYRKTNYFHCPKPIPNCLRVWRRWIWLQDSRMFHCLSILTIHSNQVQQMIGKSKFELEALEPADLMQWIQTSITPYLQSKFVPKTVSGLGEFSK